MSKLSKALHMFVAEQWVQGNARTPITHSIWCKPGDCHVQVGDVFELFSGITPYVATKVLEGAGWFSPGAQAAQQVLQDAKPEQVLVNWSKVYQDEIYVHAEEPYKWNRSEHLKYKGGNSPMLFLLAAYRKRNKNVKRAVEVHRDGISAVNAIRTGQPIRGHAKSDLSNAQAEQVLKQSQKLNTLLLHRDLANALEAVNRVLHWGCNERQPPYPETGWKDVPLDKYKQALLRHQSEWMKDPSSIDSESGKLHLAHMATNALILLQRWPEEGKNVCSYH